MAVESTKLMTADDLWALPDHGGRRELIGGIPTPQQTAPGTRYGRLSAEKSVTVHAPGGLAQTYVGAATVDLNPAVPGWQLALSDLFS